MNNCGYGRVQAYANSKLANVLFTKELHRRFHGKQVYIDPSPFFQTLNMKIDVFAQLNFFREIIFTLFFFTDSGVTAYAIHPGAVSTELSNHLEEWFPSWWNNTFGIFFKTFFLKTSWNGAQTSIHCAISEDMEELSGHYFA